MKNYLFLFSVLFLISCGEEDTPPEPTTYTLTLQKNIEEGGRVMTNPSSGPDFSIQQFEEGTILEVMSYPYDGYVFDGWTGSVESSERDIELVMDGNKNLTGNFSNGVYLDSNGVTIKASKSARIGDTGVVNGVTYTILDKRYLRGMINSGLDVSNVCTSKITDMYGLGLDSDVKGDISTWDVSNVTNMSRMFDNSQFNGDISNWDVSSVNTMRRMFSENFVFNQDLSRWNVDNVTDCDSFSQDTSQWTLPKPNFTNCNPD